MGWACALTGHVNEMEAAYEQALRLAVTPDDEVETWLSRGLSENNCDHWMDALRSFEEAAEREPEWSFPWEMRGMVLRTWGRLLTPSYVEEARRALDQALALSTEESRNEQGISFLKGTSLSGLDRWEEAEQCEEEAAELRQHEQTRRGPSPTVH